MFKLQNNIQHYAWGSLTALSDYFGYANPKQLPMAELWMGAHPSASSLIFMNGTWQSLREEIAYHSESMLGKEVALRFHQLPFLVKVLAVEQPLSIQVHPNRLAAKQGFIQENAQGLPVDSPIRNYRDANHKPELIYTLTPFTALNGFKPLVDIVHTFQAFDCGMTEANIFIKNPNRDTLQKLFLACLCLDGEEKPRVLHELKRVAEQLSGDPWLTVLKIAKYWPTDHGLFMPLFLNIAHLVPGQAMYLAAGTPHTYLHGLALEVMANSDNVLRAGLTAKHIDINELVKNVVFKESHPEYLHVTPSVSDNIKKYSVPEDDFILSIISISQPHSFNTLDQPVIIFCLDGKVGLLAGDGELTLNLGQSAFIPASQGEFSLTGTGLCAVVTVG